MTQKYSEYKQLDLVNITQEINDYWKKENIFQESIKNRKGLDNFIFYEGPPSANGKPGIHHAMGRTLKDVFCRYKTLKGYLVPRKAGWDTHGLPVELGVEKELGITKEDIGKTISIEEYNLACRKAVMKYTDIWNNLTDKLGYWLDLDEPYITYENKYIESVWWLLAQLYKKDLIYKGYTIQPYSPAAGTGLSSHELNLPGTYQNVKDTTVVAQFRVNNCCIEKVLAYTEENKKAHGELFFLAWTTTPWTLPSNTALAVGKNIDYIIVNTFNQYTFEPITVVLAEALKTKFFPEKNKELLLSDYNEGDKNIPYEVIGKMKGHELEGRKYEQLMPFVQPADNPEYKFKVIIGDFVTTEDGTGIVHIAPTFGADDARVAAQNNVPAMLIIDKNGNKQPLVNLQGKFVEEIGEPFAGKYVKNEYYTETTPEKSVDVEIAIYLKEKNRAFKVEKYEHSYPHCWRTDKPVLYYPLDSWFIKSTAYKEQMIKNNETINWKPKATGTGRFGNWLQNLNDWNLSRSRFWGIPIPIWSTDDSSERIIISSVEELKKECQKSVEKGLMEKNPLEDFQAGNMSKENYELFDLHKNEVDKIILVSPSGKAMYRESDLIDVWFDSGSMPYAQWHYPFENKDFIDQNKTFPADFIAEGVDQTRGWFFTLHAIGTMVFDSVAFKNVISNGLVLDKNGQKMSKRLGNAVDPFMILDKYGADATRWYMMTNAQPWDNLKFNEEGIQEIQRKFFGTLHNTYSFFSLYANIDGFKFENSIDKSTLSELDQWILSKLNSLIKNTTEAYEDYDATLAGRLIQEFVNDHLSNWYVRLGRRRFWKSEDSSDKNTAYQTLYTCLETIAIIASPIAPFFCDRLFLDLNKVTKRYTQNSVHLVDFPTVNSELINLPLENYMEVGQKVTSMVLSLRKKEKIRVRQPLQKVMIPILNDEFEKQINHVKHIILSEVNIKDIQLLKDTKGILTKKIKPNFKTIGPKYGKQMKQIASMINRWKDEEIQNVEINNGWVGQIENMDIKLDLEDFIITTEDIPGYSIASEGIYTVALDIEITEELKAEGMARELINRLQNTRKQIGLEVTDTIEVEIKNQELINNYIEKHQEYIKTETLSTTLRLVDNFNTSLEVFNFDIDEVNIELTIHKN